MYQNTEFLDLATKTAVPVVPEKRVGITFIYIYKKSFGKKEIHVVIESTLF